MSRAHIYTPRELGARIADGVTTFFGTWISLGLHTLWFILWFVLALDIALLTNIVSLEAIGLAILILMSQSRTSKRDKLRDDLEADEVSELFQINKTQLDILKQQSEILELLHQTKEQEAR